MVGVSNRIAHYARKMQPPPAPLFEYEVIDPHHAPDLNGELAGGKVYKKGGKEFVKLTREQAQFHLSNGALQLVPPPAPAGAKVQAAAAPSKPPAPKKPPPKTE